MNFPGIENPSACSSRRKEALIYRGRTQERNMEPPYVGCYETVL
jgi:hypothetical protein